MDEQAARELDELERRVLSPGVTFAWDRGSGGAVNMHWLRPGTILDAIPGGQLEAAILAAGRSAVRASADSANTILMVHPRVR